MHVVLETALERPLCGGGGPASQLVLPLQSLLPPTSIM